MQEKEKLQTLKDLMSKELDNLKIADEYKSLDKILSNGRESAKFIRELIHDDYELPAENSNLYDTAEMRARHSVITFLMGLVFKNFEGLFDSIPSIIKNPESNETAKHMWLITSLYHDIAYHSTYIAKPTLNYKDNFNPYLLEDIYDNQWASLNHFSKRFTGTMAYTYEEINAYDKYAREYHAERDDNEKIDHGILGGIVTFERLATKSVKLNLYDELSLIKACSITIAQHNIFKCPSEKDMKRYERHPELQRLYYNSDFKITKHTPLLLFLCLIDTVECVKKFSKANNNNSFLQTLTTLSSIKVAVNRNSIKLDISELHKRVKEKKDTNFNKEFENYKEKCLNALTEWTTFSVNIVDDYIEISLDNTSDKTQVVKYAI